MRLVQSCLLVLFALSCLPVTAQTVPPTFQQRVKVALSASGSFPASVALSGNANWVAGSQNDSGILSLQVSADGSMSENWAFSAVSHSYTQGPLNFTNFSRSCVFTDAKGLQHSVAGPNCMQSLPWFFPSFVLQPAYAAELTILDQTDDAEATPGLVKLTYSMASPTPTNAQTSAIPTLIQKATSFSIYYDGNTALPSRLVFQQTFDNDDARAIEVAIEYSDYSLESGFMVPHHLQRYVQRTLTADFTVSTTTIQ